MNWHLIWRRELTATCVKQTNLYSPGPSSRAWLNCEMTSVDATEFRLNAFQVFICLRNGNIKTPTTWFFKGYLNNEAIFSSFLKCLETLGDFFSRVCHVIDVIGILCFSDHLLCPLEMSPIHPVHKGNNSLYKHRTSQLQLPIHSGDI